MNCIRWVRKKPLRSSFEREEYGLGARIPTFTADRKWMCYGDEDGQTRIWDVSTGEVIHDFGPETGVDASITADGSKVISAFRNHAFVWNARTHQRLASWELPGETGKNWGNNLVITSDGRLVAINYERNKKFYTGIWEVESKKQIHELESNNKICFSPDGKKLGGLDGVYDIASGKRLFGGMSSNSFTWSPDGKMAVFGTNSDMLVFLDAQTGKEIKKIEGPKGYLWSIAFSSDGRYFAASTWHITRIWDTKTWEKVEECGASGRISFLPQPK